MSPRRRVLVDWDYAASGLWSVPSVAERRVPAPRGPWSAGAPRADRRPWADQLSGDLLDALSAWNKDGEALDRKKHATAAERAAFWERAAELAERVQDELGRDYEVLHRTFDGAWKWVRPPW